MAVYLSPGVYPREIDISQTASATGALMPAFIGTAKKGPVNQPIFLSNAQQFIDTFGEPFLESYLGYAVLAYFEEGNRAWVLRVGVECEQGQVAELADICIDTSGARGHGWGRIPVFAGIDYGRICTRVIDVDNPLSFHQALIGSVDYTDAVVHPTEGPASATLTFADIHGYTDPIDDTFTVLITGDPIATATLDGATYEVVRASDGAIMAVGTLAESMVPGTSTSINLGNGIVLAVVVAGFVAIGNGDTFVFSVVPDNRYFSFNVDRQNTTESAVHTPVNVYVMPDGAIYTTPDDFATAVNVIVPSSEPYFAAVRDDTACFQTDVAGRNIQIESSEAFALEVGQSIYAYDIPRSYLSSTAEGPYKITADNNRIALESIASNEITSMEFSISIGAAVAAATLASWINANGIYHGSRYFRSFSMLVPGGEEQVFIETYLDHQLEQLKLLADLSHFKTLQFSTELDILYPYTRAYRAFTDSRVILPDSGTTPNIPLSCELHPGSNSCIADSAYFQNIVGFFAAISPGTWIDSYKLTLEVMDMAEGQLIPNFRIVIEDANGVVIESIENVIFDSTQDRYVGNVINPGSKYGGVNGNSFINWIPRPSFLNNDPVNDPTNYEVRVPGGISRKEFVGGENGIPPDPAYSSEIDRAIIGNPSKESGIYAFQNPELYDITLLVIPGVSSGAVIGQGLQLCEARGDCMMLVDPPFGLRPQQVVDWHNGILFSDLSRAINSSYGALYHPWLKIYDQFSGEYIFIPPSGHVSAVYARTARDTEQWFAPAGLQRGRLLTPIDTEVDLTLGERDLMYGFGNAVNPIVNFQQDGITVWGQRTLQRTASALDRVNVRLLLIYIKKNAVRLLRPFVFEPNDAITRAQVASVSNTFLGEIAGRRGLTAYNVICDERNNTPERVDRNELHVAYFLKPTRTAEFIVLNLVVLRTSASFGAEEVLAAGGVVASGG